MVLSIGDAFEKLRSNLEISDLQEKTVSTRQQNVREVIENDFEVLDSFLTGSYKRSTMIAPLSEADVDIFIVLKAKYWSENGQADLLAKVRNSLRKTYTKTPTIRPDGHAVTITFTDFKVDVVPAFNRNGGGYLIPDTELKKWLPTNPLRHVELWSASNKQHDGDFVPLLKMLKGWNKSRSLLKSFHLETLAYSILDGVTISDFPSAVRYFFDKARAKIIYKLPDPAGYTDDVAAHVSLAQAKKIAERLEWAYSTALEAEQLDAAGKTSAAFAKWQLIFKGYFPTYS